jgi:hypothetical protein
MKHYLLPTVLCLATTPGANAGPVLDKFIADLNVELLESQDGPASGTSEQNFNVAVKFRDGSFLRAASVRLSETDGTFLYDIRDISLFGFGGETKIVPAITGIASPSELADTSIGKLFESGTLPSSGDCARFKSPFSMQIQGPVSLDEDSSLGSARIFASVSNEPIRCMAEVEVEFSDFTNMEVREKTDILNAEMKVRFPLDLLLPEVRSGEVLSGKLTAKGVDTSSSGAVESMELAFFVEADSLINLSRAGYSSILRDFVEFGSPTSSSNIAKISIRDLWNGLIDISGSLILKMSDFRMRPTSLPQQDAFSLIVFSGNHPIDYDLKVTKSGGLVTGEVTIGAVDLGNFGGTVEVEAKPISLSSTKMEFSDIMVNAPLSFLSASIGLTDGGFSDEYKKLTGADLYEGANELFSGSDPNQAQDIMDWFQSARNGGTAALLLRSYQPISFAEIPGILNGDWSAIPDFVEIQTGR